MTMPFSAYSMTINIESLYSGSWTTSINLMMFSCGASFFNRLDSSIESSLLFVLLFSFRRLDCAMANKVKVSSREDEDEGRLLLPAGPDLNSISDWYCR